MLDCFDIDITKRKFEPGDGLFLRGIKLIENLKLSYEQQVQEIRNLPGMIAFDPENKKYRVDLGWAGRYYVSFKDLSRPICKREDNSDSTYNPFINDENELCLGDTLETYIKCYRNKNFLDCVKIINAILSCKNDSHCYRGKRWRELGISVPHD